MTSRKEPPALAVLEAAYRLIWRLLPGELRDAYRDEARDVFRDTYRAVYEQRGILAAAAFVARAWTHVLACAVIERTTKPNRSASGSGVMRRIVHGLMAVIERVAQDISYASRTYLRRPVFAVTAILIVGTGVGATTTIYSVVDGVLLRKLPYPEPERLVFFDHGSHSGPFYRELRERTTSFSLLAATYTADVDLTGDDKPTRLRGAVVSRDFMRVFGAMPLLGRLFVNEDFIGEGGVVLSHGAWQRQWGSDPGIVGRPVTLNGEPRIVVGVLPRQFQSPGPLVGKAIDVWFPIDLEEPRLNAWDNWTLGIVARLGPAVTAANAQAELDVFAGQLADEQPEFFRGRDGTPVAVEIMPLIDATVGEVSGTLYLLSGAVAMMLLIACANLANLFLARGADRAREIALRAALGAGRRRIAAQLITESVFIALLGGAVGVGLAKLGVAAFAQYNPGGIPRADLVTVDARVLAFALAISVMTGVAFGIVPALKAARTDVNVALKSGAGEGVARRSRLDVRSTLVVVEVSLALVLMVGAGLLFNSFLNLQRVDVGFETEQLVTVPLSLGPTFTESERLQFARDLMERVATAPGVDGVGGGVLLPFVFTGGSRCCWRTRLDPIPDRAEPGRTLSIIHPITPGYFSVLGATLLQGREFLAGDETAEPGPAVVNELVARRLFGTIDVLGQRFRMNDDELVVVGVVDEIHHWGQAEDAEAQVYVPHGRYAGEFRRFHFAVRTDVDPVDIAATLREAVWSINPDLPVDQVIPMRTLVSKTSAEPRFFAAVLMTFAGVAVVLVAGGIYGSLLYMVEQRQREVGIRMAIGARGRDVLRLFVGHGLALTGVGIAIGLVGSVALSRTLSGLVFGMSSTDPATLAAVTLLLAAVATLACYIPARRATKADPMESLRVD